MCPVIPPGPDSHILWLKAILPISSTSAPSAQYSQVEPTRARTVTIWDDPVQWYVQLSHFYHRNKTNWNPTKCNWNPIESNLKIKRVELNPRWEITRLHGASRAAFVWLQQEHDSRKFRFVEPTCSGKPKRWWFCEGTGAFCKPSRTAVRQLFFSAKSGSPTGPQHLFLGSALITVKPASLENNWVKFNRTQVWSLPCLVTKSFNQCSCWILFKLDLSK